MKLKRPVIFFVLIGVGLGMVASDIAAAPLFRPPQPGGGGSVAPRLPVVKKRVPVIIPKNWPLKRAPRAVIVRPPRRGGGHIRVEPRVFLPTIVFGGVVVSRRYERRYRHDDDRRHGYSRESLVWEDSETLFGEDEWTEFTLDCDARGAKLWFEVLNGRLQADWAEVVFDNGEVQVVEFPERTLAPGIYQLLDFRDGRRVEYVRMVAQAASREAKVSLWMER
jgi:hypothetical protein